MRKDIATYAPILPALILYSYLAHHLNFTQDDAYISFRYVANFLNGHGLVYNIGEKIEGITNFGWTTYLAAAGAVGLDYIGIAKMTGFLCGMAFIVVTYVTARRLFTGRLQWFSLVPVYLIAANQSVAYWSPAGLETSAFSFLVALSVYLFLIRSRYLAAALLLAVWVRPEGALVAGLLILIEFATERRTPRYALYHAVTAFVLLLPWLAFKLVYYGSILPNPFYAKTGFSIDQLLAGLNYVGEYFKDYGFLGLAWLLPIVMYRRLSAGMKSILLFTLLFTLYIALIGGDVLKIHRFFLPLVGFSGMVVAETLSGLLNRRVFDSSRYLLLTVITVGLLVVTYVIPHKKIDQFNLLERGLTFKEASLADDILRTDPSNFSVAISTIGMFGYRMIGHNVIDMLGLTDSTVARHPEPVAQGLKTTWRERSQNAAYVLSRKPDYIVFSTGIKPSAPSEQMLLLYPQFTGGYRSEGFWLQDSYFLPAGILISAFKRERSFEGPYIPTYSIEWVQHFKAGVEAYSSRNYGVGISEFERAMAVPSHPVYSDLLFLRAACYDALGQRQVAYRQLDSLLVLDSMSEGGHKELYAYDLLSGDTADAAIHREWIIRHSPWDLTRLETTISQALARQRARGVMAPSRKAVIPGAK